MNYQDLSFLISVILCNSAILSIIYFLIFCFSWGSSKWSMLSKYACLSSISCTIWSNISSSSSLMFLFSFVSSLFFFFKLKNILPLDLWMTEPFCRFSSELATWFSANQISLHQGLEVGPLSAEFLIFVQICPATFWPNLPDRLLDSLECL